MVHQLCRRSPAGGPGLAVRPVLVAPRRMAGEARDRRRHCRAVGRRQPAARHSPPAPGRGTHSWSGGRTPRSVARGLGGRSGGAARTACRGSHTPEEDARGQGLSLRAAVVRDHRPARRRQDDRPSQCRAALSARRRNGPGCGSGGGRHEALRLVVHRRGGADRHGRPLYHAGFRRRGRPRRMGGFSRPPEAHARAPALERRHRRDLGRRDRRRAARRAPGARPLDPPPGQGALRQALGPVAGLCALHQGRPDRRVHRILRRSRPRQARAGVGRDVSADPNRGRSRRPFRRPNSRPWSSA